MLRDPEAIPLVGVPRASERAYRTAPVLATERAIEHAVARGIEGHGRGLGHPRGGGRRAGHARALALGAPLAPRRRLAAVVGHRHLGPGRRTGRRGGRVGQDHRHGRCPGRLRGAAGHVVLGTSTSGQAARDLGPRGGHRRVADPGLAALAARARPVRAQPPPRPGARRGGHGGRPRHRLPPRPGPAGRGQGGHGRRRPPARCRSAVGALGALVERHGGVVHTLDQNVRQQDQAEREALADLRAGDVSRAVEFYVDARPGGHRSRTPRRRARQSWSTAWAADIGQGKDTAMFAWRRANVAELNRLARERMAAEGRLAGPELVARGGARYAAGDRIVTLAPAASGTVVTSERAWCTAVDLEHSALAARWRTARGTGFEREEIGADAAGPWVCHHGAPEPRGHHWTSPMSTKTVAGGSWPMWP